LKCFCSILCFVLSLVCGYVFLANFEYPGLTWGKIVFGSLGMSFLAGGVVIAMRRRWRQ